MAKTEQTERKQSKWSGMSAGEIIERYVICLLGIFCISFGVALFTKSGTGTSAISVIPYTLSLVLPQLTYGTWVALFNMLLVLFQVLLLRSKSDWFDIVQQLVFCTIFGSIVDLSMWILTYFNPSVYWQCFITMCISVPVLALGAYLTLISRVGVMAGDGFARTVSQVSGKEFAVIRVISDSSMAIIAAVMCLAFWGQLVTVREGTVVAALFTGATVGWYSKHLKKFEYKILPANHVDDMVQHAQAHVPAENFVVTISREYGSGGREIGRTIAEKLDIAFYDSEIINRMATDEGFDAQYVQTQEQKVGNASRALFYRLYAGAVPAEDLPHVEQLYHAEQRVIKRLAAEGDCVIVGRLASYILREHKNRFDLFIGANMDDRIKHVMEREGLSEQAAESKIRSVEHARTEHCRYFAHREWGDARNYDATINTSRYGIARTGEMLADLVEDARELGLKSADEPISR